MEPSGRFVLISLPDGRTIADLKLEAEPSLTDMTLLASGDQYFLLTRQFARRSERSAVSADARLARTSRSTAAGCTPSIGRGSCSGRRRSRSRISS